MTATFTLEASGAVAVAADLTRASATAQARATRATRHYGQLLQTRVKANASRSRRAPTGAGAGGPRLITGDYNRGIGLQFVVTAGGFAAEAGTNHDQGRRLELGFVGTDSAGRDYDQPPYPHFGPAADRTEPEFVAAMMGIADFSGGLLSPGLASGLMAAFPRSGR